MLVSFVLNGVIVLAKIAHPPYFASVRRVASMCEADAPAQSAIGPASTDSARAPTM